MFFSSWEYPVHPLIYCSLRPASPSWSRMFSIKEHRATDPREQLQVCSPQPWEPQGPAAQRVRGRKQVGRVIVMHKVGVWGFTTFFRTEDTVKSSPEITKQVASESASVRGQNLVFYGENWSKRPKKEKLHVCV